MEFHTVLKTPSVGDKGCVHWDNISGLIGIKSTIVAVKSGSLGITVEMQMQMLLFTSRTSLLPVVRQPYSIKPYHH